MLKNDSLWNVRLRIRNVVQVTTIGIASQDREGFLQGNLHERSSMRVSRNQRWHAGGND